jgi:hypothetical protein
VTFLVENHGSRVAVLKTATMTFPDEVHAFLGMTSTDLAASTARVVPADTSIVLTLIGEPGSIPRESGLPAERLDYTLELTFVGTEEGTDTHTFALPGSRPQSPSFRNPQS